VSAGDQEKVLAEVTDVMPPGLFLDDAEELEEVVVGRIGERPRMVDEDLTPWMPVLLSTTEVCEPDETKFPAPWPRVVSTQPPLSVTRRSLEEKLYVTSIVWPLVRLVVHAWTSCSGDRSRARSPRTSTRRSRCSASPAPPALGSCSRRRGAATGFDPASPESADRYGEQLQRIVRRLAHALPS
jgi:hypothetical protein